MRGKSPRRGVRAAGLDETPALVSSWKERSSFDRRLLLNDLAEFFDCPAPDLVVVRQTNPPSLVVSSWLKGSLTWKLVTAPNGNDEDHLAGRKVDPKDLREAEIR